MDKNHLSPVLRLREEQFRLITISMLIVAMLALGLIFYFARLVLIPFVLALFISILVSPVQTYLVVNRKLPFWIGFVASLLVVLSVVILLVALLSISVKSVIQGGNEYSSKLISSIDQFTQWCNSWTQPWGYEVDFQSLKLNAQQWSSSLASQTMALFQTLLQTVTLLTIFLFFLLLGRNPHVTSKGIFAQVEAHTRKYILIKTIISIITGIGAWIILKYTGCPMAEMIGMATFILNYIPSIGSIIATFLPIPLVIAQGSDPMQIVWIILLLGILQNVMGNLIEPKIQGEGLKLHPVAILLSLAIWGLLWGPIGMFLAAPIAAVIRVLLDQFETTRPFALMLGGASIDKAFGEETESRADTIPLVIVESSTAAAKEEPLSKENSNANAAQTPPARKNIQGAKHKNRK